MLTYIKFFEKDIISGQAKKVGDRFVAFFMVGDVEFEVVKHCGDHFFADPV